MSTHAHTHTISHICVKLKSLQEALTWRQKEHRSIVRILKSTETPKSATRELGNVQRKPMITVLDLLDHVATVLAAQAGWPWHLNHRLYKLTSHQSGSPGNNRILFSPFQSFWDSDFSQLMNFFPGILTSKLSFKDRLLQDNSKHMRCLPVDWCSQSPGTSLLAWESKGPYEIHLRGFPWLFPSTLTHSLTPFFLPFSSLAHAFCSVTGH